MGFGFRLVFSPDDRFLAFTNGSGVSILNLRSGHVEHTFPADASEPVIVFAPDGGLVTVGASGLMRRWSLRTGRAFGAAFPILLEDDLGYSSTVSADGRTEVVVTGSLIQVWDTVNARLLFSTVHSHVWAGEFDLGPTGSRLVARYADRLLIWHLPPHRS